MSKLTKAVPKDKRDEIASGVISRLLDYLFKRLRKRAEKPTEPAPELPAGDDVN